MARSKVVFRYTQPWILGAWDKVLVLILLFFLFLFYPGQNLATLLSKEKNPDINPLSFVLPTPAAYPIHVSGIVPGEEVSAAGVVVVDVDSNIVLYKRNDQELLSPASTTKILTALVALDTYSLDDVVLVQDVVSDGQTMGLVPGENITVENLLYGILIHSGNDAAFALASHYPGGVPAFVGAMNRYAAEIHLTNSTFTNPAGFYDPGHKMTAFDLARLATVALNNKTIAKMVAIPQITVGNSTHTYFHQLKNVNELLGKIPGVGGIKTGWTEEAGENLVTLMERDGHKVVLVVLHSSDRFADTTRLIEWVFANYRWETILPPTE